MLIIIMNTNLTFSWTWSTQTQQVFGPKLNCIGPTWRVKSKKITEFKGRNVIKNNKYKTLIQGKLLGFLFLTKKKQQQHHPERRRGPYHPTTAPWVACTVAGSFVWRVLWVFFPSVYFIKKTVLRMIFSASVLFFNEE